MEEKFYKQLVERYLNKQLSDDELEVFLHLLSEDKLDKYLLEAMDKDVEMIEESETPIRPIRTRPYQFLYKAAAILILSTLTFFGYKFITGKSKIENTVENYLAEIKPATNKAILTLENGEKIVLNDSTNTVLLSKSGVTIKQDENGVIIYDGFATQAPSTSSISGYNTIETPKGGIYQVILPDNSKVWLNNESRIKFPVQFSKTERKVEINGEVYFEVAPNKNKPFRVVSKEQTVEVLGTHFNVNSYADEFNTKTSLLEGSVRVTNSKKLSKIIKPGQQAITTNANMEITNIDIDQVVAWKNGDFVFEGTSLETIMRQISRWYDIEVVYQGSIKNVQFGGSISRTKNINEVLRVLEMTQGVNFKLEGRRVLVMP